VTTLSRAAQLSGSKRSSSHGPVKPRQSRGNSRSGGFSRWCQRLVSGAIGLAILGFILFQLVMSFGAQLFPLTEDEHLLLVSSEINGRTPVIVGVVIAPASSRVTVVSLPVEEKVPVMGGYGEYQLGAVWPLLKTNQRQPEFIRAAYSVGLEYPWTVVMQTEAAASYQAPPDLQRLLWSVLWRPQPHASWRQRAAWYFYIRNYNLSQVDELKPSTLSELSRLWSQLPQPVNLEACAVAVVNTTATAGLASQVTTVLEHSQVLVVKTTDSTQRAVETGLSIESEGNCAQVTRLIQAVMPRKLLPHPNPVLTTEYRAKQVLLIGEDVAQALEQ